jgi:hypothetical protein
VRLLNFSVNFTSMIVNLVFKVHYFWTLQKKLNVTVAEKSAPARMRTSQKCLTAWKALSHANAKRKGINYKGLVCNQVFRLAEKERK